MHKKTRKYGLDAWSNSCCASMGLSLTYPLINLFLGGRHGQFSAVVFHEFIQRKINCCWFKFCEEIHIQSPDLWSHSHEYSECTEKRNKTLYANANWIGTFFVSVRKASNSMDIFQQELDLVSIQIFSIFLHFLYYSVFFLNFSFPFMFYASPYIGKLCSIEPSSNFMDGKAP